MPIPKSSIDRIWTTDTLAQAIIEAVDRLVEQQDRSDGSLSALANVCQGLPRSIVDQASAAAFEMLVFRLEGAAQPSKLDNIIAFKLFVHDVGATKFEASLLRTVRRHLESMPIEANIAFRAQLLSLLALIGHAVPAEQLESEILLREAEPLTWLDLAIGQLAPSRLVRNIDLLLRRDVIRPDNLIPFSPLIFNNFGPGVLQEVIDHCCYYFYERSRFVDASQFVEDIELVEPQGWTQPFGRNVVEVSRLKPVEEIVDNVLNSIEAGVSTPASGLAAIRNICDPILTAAAAKGDVALPNSVVRRLQHSTARLFFQVAAKLPIWGRPDATGIDWFQGNPIWPHLKIGEKRFLLLAEKMVPPTHAQPNSPANDEHPESFRLIEFARAAGFYPTNV